MASSKILAIGVVAVVVIAAVAVCIIVANNNNEESGIKITNTDGTTTTIPEVAEKIAVMNVNTAEAIIDIGAGKKVVGVSSTAFGRAEYKSEFAEDVINLGTSTSPSLDKIVECNPDVVIAFSTMKLKNQDQVEKLGYPVLYLDCYNIYNDQIFKDVENLGKALGLEESAKKYIDYFKGKMDKINEYVSKVSADDRSNMKIYAEFSSVNYETGYCGQQKGTSTDGILSFLGVNSVTKDVPYPDHVSSEFIAQSNAQYIVKIYDTTKADKDSVLSEVANRPFISTLPAKTSGEIYLMNNQISYGPRMFVACFAFFEIMFPTQAAESGMTIAGLLKDYNDTFGVSFNTTIPIVVKYAG